MLRARVRVVVAIVRSCIAVCPASLPVLQSNTMRRSQNYFGVDSSSVEFDIFRNWRTSINCKYLPHGETQNSVKLNLFLFLVFTTALYANNSNLLHFDYLFETNYDQKTLRDGKHNYKLLKKIDLKKFGQSTTKSLS